MRTSNLKTAVDFFKNENFLYLQILYTHSAHVKNNFFQTIRRANAKENAHFSSKKKEIMVFLKNISYVHPNGDILFNNIYLSVQAHQKVALIGNNGAGKSTLLKVIANVLQATGGQKNVNAEAYYIPQVFGQYNHLTIAAALKIDHKLHALQEIVRGNTTEENYTALADDWTIENRCHEALQHWNLEDLNLYQKMGSLSGGQKTKVFLAGISIHQPALLLLDEPSNHLDLAGRQLLYNFVQSASNTMIIVTHDKKMLRIPETVCELSHHGIKVFNGNYDSFLQQQKAEQDAIHQSIQNHEKTLRRARQKERETLERQQKLDSRGKNKQEKAGIAKIMMNTFKNKAENSTAKLKNTHAEKVDSITRQLQDLHTLLPDIDKIKFGFAPSPMHKGKILFTGTHINISYPERILWKESLTLQITSGERIALKGANGTGKTTLLQLILGKPLQHTGNIYTAIDHPVYIDQEYSLIRNELTVYEQAKAVDTAGLQEHEIKTKLNHFLFTKSFWDKPCSALSGGERMRLVLCCFTIISQAPDLIVLDEPTNNLDIQNVAILSAAVNAYKGTLLVVSHDEDFLRSMHITRTVDLDK